MILTEYTEVDNNVWEPPEIRDGNLAAYLSPIQPGESVKRDCLIIFMVKPYIDALVNNDTTILFVRKEDSFNQPFIKMEIFCDQLMQAYHRFDEDCTEEEAN